MYQRLNSVFGQIFLQFVAPLRTDGEYMEHVVVATAPVGESDVRIPYIVKIYLGQPATMFVVGVYVFQLHVQHRGLNLVKTRIVALVSEYILALRAIVAERTDSLGKFAVAGGYGPAVAERAEILAGIETMRRGQSEASGTFTIIFTSVSLRVVLVWNG